METGLRHEFWLQGVSYHRVWRTPTEAFDDLLQVIDILNRRMRCESEHETRWSRSIGVT